MSGPRIGELFSGYGGLGMGVQSVYGGTIAWHSDIDKGACKILAHRYPDVPNIGDITTVDWSQVEPVDILTGGSPCQDLSHAGARKGMTEGTRSNLWVAMREAIAQLRPATVVWENVRGAYSAAADSEVEPCPGCVGDGSGVHLRALGRVLGDLSELGYDCRWHGLRAADVGAPHGRFRVFVVAADADSAGAGRNGRAVPSSVGQVGWQGVDIPASIDGGHGTTPDTADLGHERSRRARDWWARLTDRGLLPTPSVADATGGHERRGGARGNELLLTSSEASHGQISGQISGQYREATTEALGRWGDYASAIVRWETALGRPAPAPTMTSTKGNPQLSPRFVEWLMGLPAGWVDDVPGLTRNEKLKALGNGVVPQQCAEALRVMDSWAVAA